jgi:hypothetical protein
VAESAETTNIRINLKKAQDAPHYLYFVRLTWALNDLLSTLQLSQAVEDASGNLAFKIHLKAYCLRLEQAHLVEACKAFVYLVKPNKPKQAAPEYEWIANHKTVSEKFEHLRSLLNAPMYKRFQQCRDSFIFHYNHQKNSPEVEKAFEELAHYWDKWKEQGPSQLNLLSRAESPLASRFFVADHMVYFAWMQQMGMKPNDPAEPEMRELRGSVLGGFVDYAEEAILTWVTENKLQSSR